MAGGDSGHTAGRTWGDLDRRLFQRRHRGHHDRSLCGHLVFFFFFFLGPVGMLAILGDSTTGAMDPVDDLRHNVRRDGRLLTAR